MVFNEEGDVFLAQRGPKATNERGCWEFPGGRVEFGERLAEAIRREISEEYGMNIEVVEQLCAVDHLLPDEHQHWVAITFLARYVSGGPCILEPEKCTSIGWFSLSDLPQPLSVASSENITYYKAKHG